MKYLHTCLYYIYVCTYVCVLRRQQAQVKEMKAKSRKRLKQESGRQATF